MDQRLLFITTSLWHVAVERLHSVENIYHVFRGTCHGDQYVNVVVTAVCKPLSTAWQTIV
eukprot:scaffold34644_cov283-Amphora_coffeaeformis.AAC.2